MLEDKQADPEYGVTIDPEYGVTVDPEYGVTVDLEYGVTVEPTKSKKPTLKIHPVY